MAPGQPQAGGHGAYGGGGSEHEGQTKSAKGLLEAPGKQVKQKSGLNRAILASGWGSLERKLAYKAGSLLKVDPATHRRRAAGAAMCTGITGRRRRCSRAGPAGSVRTPTTMRRSTFWCGRGFRACPFQPAGQGPLHGEGRSRGGPRRPVNETGTTCMSSCLGKSHYKHH